MVLVKYIRKVFAASAADRFQRSRRSVFKLALCITGDDSLPIGLAAVDDNTIGAVMTGQSLAHEALRRLQVKVFAEEEFDRVPTLSMAAKAAPAVDLKGLGELRAYRDLRDGPR